MSLYVEGDGHSGCCGVVVDGAYETVKLIGAMSDVFVSL